MFYLVSIMYSQENPKIIFITDKFNINFKNYYSLSATNIIEHSETIFIGSRELNQNDYLISYRENYFKLSDSLAYSIFDTIKICYKSINLNLEKQYQKNKLIIIPSLTTTDSIKIIKEEKSSFSTESIFGREMKQSGTIMRGFNVGTNSDFSLTSGLRLQLAGKLSDEIEIIAAITDENTPIQPEGNTERLEELDKVFIEIRHRNAIGVFGDFDLKENNGKFGKFERKLQGLKGSFNIDNYSGNIYIASSRGKFNTNQFFGIDGIQGPYRLYGSKNEKDIIIIAGSEKVFLDGEEMKRGESNDYTIDYSNAQIVFTPKRLITSLTRISVDFEYTDRQYQRNFFGTSTEGLLLNNKLKIQVGYFREGDDKDNPIDLLLSDNDKNILGNAGDDKNKAVYSGAIYTDSNAYYVRIDTVINTDSFAYYFYDPGNPNAHYQVTFTYVGNGFGDYNKESLGKYKFVGVGEGSYLPVKYLPLPESRQNANVVFEAELAEELKVDINIAGSIFDKNLFSKIDDGDNYGYARDVYITYEPKKIKIGGLNIGSMNLSLRDRFIEERFLPVDRINSVEFNRDYNVSGASVGNEILREINFNWVPTKDFSLNSKYGYLKKGNNFSSNRYFSRINYNRKDSAKFSYSIDYVNTTNNLISSDWFKQNAEAKYSIWIFRPGILFNHEVKKNKLSVTDSLLCGSLKFIDYSPFIEINNFYGFNFTFLFSYREEFQPDKIYFKNESKSYTSNYFLEYRGIREFTTNLNLTVREKKYSNEYKKLGYLNNETVLIHSLSKFNLMKNFLTGDLFYKVGTERSARLEKVFVRVPQGSGNYIYLGDLNGNGIAEENEFELSAYDGDFIITTIPTDELFPVIDLRTSTKWNLKFDELIKDDTFLSSILRALSTETFIRVEENSRDENLSNIYLLKFSHFMQKGTTIRGSNFFQQDLFIFKNSNDLSFRFRYTQRKSLSEYSSGIENSFFRERSVKIKFRLVKEINNQTDFKNSNDNVSADFLSNRVRTLTTNDIITDFSYRPIGWIELGIKIQTGTSTDRFPNNPTIIDFNSQVIRFNFSFTSKGRLRFELERNEFLTNNSQNYIPFEITRGNNIGKNYIWRVNFDFRFATNFQTMVSYDGRKHEKGKVIHTMRAEARAYF
ncbi:MAG: hypothetical protein JW866_07570 [Ignavibacteriales bacterium]|nr:hypothetical protein [Ignavibacteriales bacterium]